MQNMAVHRLSRWFAIALGCALAFTAAGTAVAQDRVVGRDAVDPASQEALPPSVDGRTDAEEEIDPEAIEEFREPLAPYGAWVQDERYGTVWVPDARVVGPDFYPYSTAGRWELTSDGDWLWVSDYSWGDIPFHYGRWVWIEGRGWSWIPGRVWAPAWVVWRTGPHGYIGWAPCPPTWTWWWGTGGWYGSWLYWPPPAAYVFVHTRHVFHHHVHRHVIRTPARARAAAQHTSPQRRPASPGAPTFDRNRPASPDMKAIRYDGPKPRVRPTPRPSHFAASERPSTRSPGAARLRESRTLDRDERGTRARGEGRPSRSPVLGTGLERGRGLDRGWRPAAPSPRPGRWSPPDRRTGPGVDGMRPSRSPGLAPSRSPGLAPSRSPGLAPSRSPGLAPSRSPGRAPTIAPSRGGGSSAPSLRPSPRSGPSRIDTPRPSAPPSRTIAPSQQRRPSAAPAPRPSPRPSVAPRGRGGRR